MISRQSHAAAAAISRDFRIYNRKMLRLRAPLSDITSHASNTTVLAPTKLEDKFSAVKTPSVNDEGPPLSFPPQIHNISYLIIDDSRPMICRTWWPQSQMIQKGAASSRTLLLRRRSNSSHTAAICGANATWIP